MRRLILAATVLLTLVAVSADELDFPVLPLSIPGTIAAARPDLVLSYTSLKGERVAVLAKASAFTKACDNHVLVGSALDKQCAKDFPILSAEATAHLDKTEAFLKAYDDGVKAFVIKSMNASAIRLGWNKEERDRLDAALRALSPDGTKHPIALVVAHVWSNVLARGTDTVFAREAAEGRGPGFPGAGLQTNNQDCAVFALANAAGLPYGVAAARATKLIAEGEWRETGERAAPQRVIERSGLIGGEVVMLAEAFGQVDVVQSTAFAETLRGGRPIMVSVVGQSGDLSGAHQVVLTKTFQHGAETFYEVMDSNQGPTRRLYVSAGELNNMLKESGVAYRPEDKTTPMLLR